MSSSFFPKIVSQARLKSWKVGQTGHPEADHGQVEGKSTFSKMRKKRPPPINIVCENVFMARAAATSNAPCGVDLHWSSPASPRTPHTVGCVNPRCIEWDVARMSPWHSHPLNGSNPLTPSRQCFPPAELPGSLLSPMSAEMEATSFRRRFSFERGRNESVEEIPDLVPSSAPPMAEGFSGLRGDHDDRSADCQPGTPNEHTVSLSFLVAVEAPKRNAVVLS